MRMVMIGTPAHDGRVDVRYVDALVQSIRSSPEGIVIAPVFIPGDALVERARNYLVSLALEAGDGRGVDDLVMIDSDTVWTPGGLFRLLSHQVDVVGGLVRQCTEEQVVCIRRKAGAAVNEAGLLEVESIGCGFLRFSRAALAKLSKASRTYKNGTATNRMVFELSVNRAGQLVGEDIAACDKWRKLGGKVYADTAVLCGHVGVKLYGIEGAKNKDRDLREGTPT